jgi:iron-sulfur cluster assembly accessory protein
MQQAKSTEQIVNLTEKAANKIKQFLEKDGQKGSGFRVGVSKGGCSGYTYEMGVEKEPKADDNIIEDKGVKVFINPESVEFIKGSTVDYIDALVNAGFKVNNPNVKRTCGCGHSVG